MSIRQATARDVPLIQRLLAQLPNPPRYDDHALALLLENPNYYVFIEETRGLVCFIQVDHLRREITVPWLLPVPYFLDGTPNPDGAPLLAFRPLLKATVLAIHARDPRAGVVGTYRRGASFDGLSTDQSLAAATAWRDMIPGSVLESRVSEGRLVYGAWMQSTVLVKDVVTSWEDEEQAPTTNRT